MQSHILAFLHTDLWVYVIASYLNKVGVSFLWVVRGLGLHACSDDCSYYFSYKHLSDTQQIIIISQMIPLQPNMQESSIVQIFHQDNLVSLSQSTLCSMCTYLNVFVLLNVCIYYTVHKVYIFVCVFKCKFACIPMSGAEGS